MTYPRKSNPYLEQRLRERERITAAPSLAEKYPKLKSLSVVIGYFDQQRMSHAGELRYRANVQHAKSIMAFACPNSNCKGGGFDLTEVLGKAITGKRKSVQGELRCPGTRSVISNRETTCQHFLHYKLSLGYA
jgi:hypothetical protein